MKLSEALLRAACQGYLITFNAMPPNHVAMTITASDGMAAQRRFEEVDLQALPDKLIAREVVRTMDNLENYRIKHGIGKGPSVIDIRSNGGDNQ